MCVFILNSMDLIVTVTKAGGFLVARSPVEIRAPFKLATVIWAKDH
jgi:hypothetical protein